jgi:hypothetical protein
MADQDRLAAVDRVTHHGLALGPRRHPLFTGRNTVEQEDRVWNHLPQSAASGSLRSGVIPLSLCIGTFQFPIEPGPGRAPVPMNRFRRDFEGAGRFFDAQTSKEAQFHHLALPRMKFRQRGQSIVESDYFRHFLLGDLESFLQS